jgi:Holliday junction resolvase RusA-like endonuclease
MPYKIILDGPPIAQARPRVTRRGFAYDPNSKEKLAVKWKIKQQYKGEPIDQPIRLKIYFSMPTPKSLSKKKQDALIGNPHCKKIDLDNLIKFYLDCMNGILYHDDSQIFSIEAVKIWAELGETEIIIS